MTAEKNAFFEIIWKIHDTKRENAFENLYRISLLTWEAAKTPKIWVFIVSMAWKKN